MSFLQVMILILFVWVLCSGWLSLYLGHRIKLAERRGACEECGAKPDPKAGLIALQHERDCPNNPFMFGKFETGKDV